jgi:hypothetical protein
MPPILPKIILDVSLIPLFALARLRREDLTVLSAAAERIINHAPINLPIIFPKDGNVMEDKEKKERR